MTDNYQNEKPPARVNLRADIKAVGDKRQSIELPFKALVMGEFTEKKQDTFKQSRGTVNLDGDVQGLLDTVKKTKKYSVNKNTFEPVMKALGPKLNYSVENKITGKGSIKVDLDITSIDSFRPETIVKNTPELNRLLTVRNLLKELKSTMLDNRDFRHRVEEIMKDPEMAKALQEELRKIVPEKT